MKAKSIDRATRRVKEKHSKVLYDIQVEYAFYSTQLSKKELSLMKEEKNKLWLNHVYKNKGNKLIDLNPSAFIDWANNKSKVNNLRKILGLNRFKKKENIIEKIKTIISNVF